MCRTGTNTTDCYLFLVYSIADTGICGGEQDQYENHLIYTTKIAVRSNAVEGDTTTIISKVYRYAEVITADITMADGNITTTKAETVKRTVSVKNKSLT